LEFSYHIRCLKILSITTLDPIFYILHKAPALCTKNPKYLKLLNSLIKSSLTIIVLSSYRQLLGLFLQFILYILCFSTNKPQFLPFKSLFPQILHIINLFLIYTFQNYILSKYYTPQYLALYLFCNFTHFNKEQVRS